MKKAAIILVITTAGIALLFAQTPDPAPAEVFPAATILTAPAFGSVAVEEEPTPDAEVAANEEGTVTDEIAMIDEVGEDAAIEEGRISLRLNDAELKDVVRMFSTLSGANIIVPDLSDEDIVKKIDVNLDNVEWKPALEAILDTHSLELYEKIPGTKVYAIRKKLPGAPEPLEVQVFKLSYASVESVTNIIGDMVGSIGSCSVFPERNVVVVQGTAKALLGVDDIVKQIDLPRQQVFIEAKFLELTDKAQRDLGVNWGVLEAYGVQATGMGMNYNKTDTRTDTDSRFTDIAGRPYENLIDDPGVSEYGADGVEIINHIDYPGRSGSPGSDDARIFGITPTAAQIDEMSAVKALTAVLGADDFRLILSALEQRDGVDLVSNPKIIVANEQEALIHLGNMEPNVVIEQKAGTSDNPGSTTSVKVDGYFEDGVKVVVKPTINTSSNITVQISPEITTFIGRKVVNSSSGLKLIDYPISQTKKIDTVFSLESGQTAAIGGLTRTSEGKKDSKIPWLGDIPLVGRLFSYKQTILDQNETIIFVTVGLANPSSIDMDTGLPQNTRLAQRYQVREKASLRVDKAELNLLRTKENMEMKKELQDLREANRKLIDNQKAQKGKEAEKEAPETEALETEVPAVEPAAAPEEEDPSVLPAEVSPEAGILTTEEEVAPVGEEPAAEMSPVQEIIEELEGTSGGGTYDVNADKPE